MLMAGIAALEASFKERLHLRLWYDEAHGIASESDIAGFAMEGGMSDVYLCGPDPFMRLVKNSLITAGFDSGKIFCEEFAQAEQITEPATSDGAVGALTSQLSVTLKGQVHQVPVRQKETLLAAMMNAKLPVPHACKVGECASCMCRLDQGSIERLSNSVLDEDDEASGWLLACRAYAIGDSVSVRFP